MSVFFSLTSDGSGNIAYFTRDARRSCLRGNLVFKTDRHADIDTHYGFDSQSEKSRNQYTYNPLTGVFTVVSINTTDDSKVVEDKVRGLLFSKIVPQLVIKPMLHPFRDVREPKVLDSDIELLKEWIVVCESVKGAVVRSVYDHVWRGLWDSVGVSVGATIWETVRDTVTDSVTTTVCDVVGRSTDNSVRDSVWNVCAAYISSFVNIPQWVNVNHLEGINPFQSGIDLWERGLVPSFDSEIWRLHGGEVGSVLFEYENWKEAFCN